MNDHQEHQWAAIKKYIKLLIVEHKKKTTGNRLRHMHDRTSTRAMYKQAGFGNYLTHGNTYLINVLSLAFH